MSRTPDRRFFRSHDTVPTLNSPLLTQLATEWVDLNRLTSTASTVRGWGRVEPALAGHGRPADVVDAVDQADSGAVDEMFLALLRLAQAGQQLAGRILLQCMLPKVTRLARSATRTTERDLWAEDRLHLAVAEMWTVIATYPVERRPRGVVANLNYDTLHRLTGGGRRAREEVQEFSAGLIDDASVMAVNDQEDASGTSALSVHSRRELVCTDDEATDAITAALSDTVTVDTDLRSLLDWAIHHDVISVEEASVLDEVYCGSSVARAAERFRLTPSAVRKRCSRARRRLVEAVAESLGNQKSLPSQESVA